MELTMMMIMPNEFSRRTNTAAHIKIKMVTGMAAIVRANSVSVFPVTMTTN